MGKDQQRREQVGREIRRSAEAAGGVFPWFADLLSDLTAVGGQAVARGARLVADPIRVSAFFRSTPVEGSYDRRILASYPDPALLAVDLNLFGPCLLQLARVTGWLPGDQWLWGMEVIRDQLAHESCLADELLWRERLGTSAHIGLTTITRIEDAMVEKLPREFARRSVPSPRALHLLINAWLDGIASCGVAVPEMSWENCRVNLDEGRVIVRRVAGAATASPTQRAAVPTMVSATTLDETVAVLAELLAPEIGAMRDAVRPLALTVAGLVSPAAQRERVGIRGLLRQLDHAARSSEERASPTRAFFLMMRQLIVFRAMADDLAWEGSLFAMQTVDGDVRLS